MCGYSQQAGVGVVVVAVGVVVFVEVVVVGVVVVEIDPIRCLCKGHSKSNDFYFIFP